MMTPESHGRVSLCALLLAAGCPPELLDAAAVNLAGERPSDTAYGIYQQAANAIRDARMGAGQ